MGVGVRARACVRRVTLSGAGVAGYRTYVSGVGVATVKKHHDVIYKNYGMHMEKYKLCIRIAFHHPGSGEQHYSRSVNASSCVFAYFRPP